MAKIHHAGLCPADIEESLHFYRDGLGLSVLFDVVLDADLEPLLGVATSKVRTIFLGDPDDRDTGAVELMDLGVGGVASQSVQGPLPTRGVALLSFHLPVEPTLARLESLGLGGTPLRMPTGPGRWAATVRDPDGVVVELLDDPISFG